MGIERVFFAMDLLIYQMLSQFMIFQFSMLQLVMMNLIGKDGRELSPPRPMRLSGRGGNGVLSLPRLVWPLSESFGTSRRSLSALS